MSSEPAASSVQAETPKAPAARQSCIPLIDALWFCYTPVHQLKRYYRYGDVDDCLSHWNELMDCFKSRTRYGKDKQPVERPKNPFWELRTKEEAAAFWDKEFAHLRQEAPKPPTGPTIA